MINMAHDRYNRRTGYFIACWLLVCKQVLIKFLARYRLGNMTEFLDNQYGCVLINHLVDGNHRSHFKKNLNDFVAFNRNSLCQLGHGDVLRNFYFSNNRSGWSFKSMLTIGANIYRATPRWRLTLASTGLVAGDM